TTTTPSDRTARSAAAPRPRPTPPDPKPPPPPHRSRSRNTAAFAATRSTPAAYSPSGTTADCTTSASADATPAPTSGCSSRSYTSASSPKTANYYASSPSTQRATTSHNAELQRCHETGVNHVPRHHMSRGGGIRTHTGRHLKPLPL